MIEALYNIFHSSNPNNTTDRWCTQPPENSWHYTGDKGDMRLLPVIPIPPRWQLSRWTQMGDLLSLGVLPQLSLLFRKIQPLYSLVSIVVPPVWQPCCIGWATKIRKLDLCQGHSKPFHSWGVQVRRSSPGISKKEKSSLSNLALLKDSAEIAIPPI